MKSIDTLVEDINALFTTGHDCDPQNAEKLGRDIAEMVVSRLKEAASPLGPYTLRMSSIGKQDRQIWYDARSKEREEFPANVRIKFLFGDILEDLLIFLAKEAGHDVQGEQQVVEVGGVCGHLDGTIDGVVVDCKSASTYSYQKFSDGSLRRNDSFGYMHQLAGYCHGSGVPDGAFLAIDKTLGHICLLKIPQEEIDLYDTAGRVQHLKNVIALPEPPERCFDDEPDGKSGNMKLGVNCSYCRHKGNCWPELRTFFYSSGPRFLTKVARLPDVPELQQQEVIKPNE